MRMWMVPPQLLCDKHLTGEHVEMHMFVGSINKRVSMAGYITNNLMQPKDLRSRHDSLAQEMAARGMNHKSPLPAIAWHKFVPLGLVHEKVDLPPSWEDLVTRCKACRALYQAPWAKDIAGYIPIIVTTSD